VSSFCNHTPPITETFRFCLIVYLYNMFQPSTGSSSGIKIKKILKLNVLFQRNCATRSVNETPAMQATTKPKTQFRKSPPRSTLGSFLSVSVFFFFFFFTLFVSHKPQIVQSGVLSKLFKS
jgi:hypothetical protein